MSKPVHQLLRRDLHFKGVIITDDLAMNAIKEYAKQTNQNVAVLAVEAGNDMLLTNDYRTDIPAIKQAVANGTISVHQLNQSVTRILRLKAKLGLINIDKRGYGKTSSFSRNPFLVFTTVSPNHRSSA
ncbi:glycoside hydrolase family 3 N-terminal domain-containing protein [Limosilactobacillus fermentum]